LLTNKEVKNETFLGRNRQGQRFERKAGEYVDLFMTAVLFLEVMLRYVFSSPTIWAHELTVHFFGAYSVLAGAYVLLHNEHIRVDIIYDRFSPRGRAIIDSVTYLLFFLFIVALLRYGIMTAWRAVELRQTVSPSPWGSPIWPLKITIPIAAF